MAKNLVKVNLHGQLGDSIGKQWDLAISSVGEAVRFIEMTSKKLYKTLLDFDKNSVKYCVIINGRNFHTNQNLSLNNIQNIKESELALKNKNLKTIDIVPVLEGAGSDILGIFTAILGAILIVVGAVIPGAQGLIFAGITLLAAGVFTLLSKPPKFEDFREIEQGGKTSYLFAGPQNIVGEGGPVPVGYGRLLVGSQVVSSAYVIRDFNAADTSSYIRNEYGDLEFLPKKPKKQEPFDCCFIFIQGEGLLTEYVRNYRDSHYGNKGLVAKGYKWMANWLVPLMKEYSCIQSMVKYLMTTPLSKYAEWHCNKNNYGWIFWPFKIWSIFWRIIGFTIK